MCNWWSTQGFGYGSERQNPIPQCEGNTSKLKFNRNSVLHRPKSSGTIVSTLWKRSHVVPEFSYKVPSEHLYSCFDINWQKQCKKTSEGNEGGWLNEEENRSLEWARISTFRELKYSPQARQTCSPNDVVKPHNSPSIRTTSISNSGKRLARQDYWMKTEEKRRERLECPLSIQLF